ncbi:Hypothetical_protein [Hexamita inflata]|uniref:Hypothetical_protein n=1 Tax=Hexamita inflata TaxID=28002 RepID=A0AA86U8S9_9EUKA|nr:Hypothetical protein HINF_LOCUS35490 [Hexamita inflata]
MTRVQASKGVTRLLHTSRSIRESTWVPSAFLRKQWSCCYFPIIVDDMPHRSLTAVQHFELEDFTFRNRSNRAVSQEAAGCGEEREAVSSITLSKASIPAVPLQLLRQTSLIVLLNHLNHFVIIYLIALIINYIITSYCYISAYCNLTVTVAHFLYLDYNNFYNFGSINTYYVYCVLVVIYNKQSKYTLPILLLHFQIQYLILVQNC